MPKSLLSLQLVKDLDHELRDKWLSDITEGTLSWRDECVIFYLIHTQNLARFPKIWTLSGTARLLETSKTSTTRRVAIGKILLENPELAVDSPNFMSVWNIVSERLNKAIEEEASEVLSILERDDES